MRAFFFMVISLSVASCSPSPSKHQAIDEDYVLIEFASRLEEDYHRIHNIPTSHSEENEKK